MRLPLPNADEVRRFQDLYERRFGSRPSHEESWDALSRLMGLIYLLEYQPVRPLREEEPPLRRPLPARKKPGRKPRLGKEAEGIGQWHDGLSPAEEEGPG